MKNLNSKLKIMLYTGLGAICLVGMFIISYLVILPSLVKSECINNIIKNEAQKTLGLNLELKNPKLITKLKPEIDFSIDSLILKKDDLILVDLDKFDISINFKNIFSKKIKLNSINAENLTLKADKLIELLPKSETQKEQKPLDWKLDIYNSKIGLQKLYLSYKLNKANILIDVNSIKIAQQEGYKTLDFKSEIKISKGNKEYLDIKANTNNNVKLLPESTYTNDFTVFLNKSKIEVTAFIDSKKLDLKAKSNAFYLEDIFKIICSDVVIPDGEALLVPLVNPKGKISYNVNFKTDIISPFDNELSGVINIASAKANLKDLNNLPLSVDKGKLVISKSKVDFQDIIGYWGKNKNNKFKIYGSILDYYNSMDSTITIDTKIKNEFFKDYLASLIGGTVLHSSDSIGTRIIYKAKYNIMDITWLAKINKGVNFGIDDSKSALSDYDRAIKGDFHIEKDKLTIKNINYYIAPDIHKGVKIKPILTIDGDMDLMGNIDRIGFFFAREMPCELLNVITKDKTFKKGTIKGSLHVAFKNKVPILNADMELKNTFIPKQRLKISEAKLKTNDNYIMARIIGRFKRANFELRGNMKNELLPPFDIKHLTLSVDNLDVERILNSFNNQEQNEVKVSNVSDDENTDDDYMFDTNLIRIEHGKFKLTSGKYKDLTFGNIDSDITLDEKGILKIQSNKFDIAQGISTLKVICDLSKLEYYIRLGVKDVDSNLMARVLLNLDKEISGKASGLIELNSDKSMKMNGLMKFEVKQGTIGKIGLVEYVLKIASVFRNPIVMISPQTIIDIVSIPEGKFDRIYGEMKISNNVVHHINIQSWSRELSALIRGRFDMERHDASIRIYTRFSTAKKSTFDFLRNISLNAIANKVQMNSRNDANYYSAELKDLPQIEIGNEKSQIFLTQVEGDVEHNNFLSTLKKIK